MDIMAFFASIKLQVDKLFKRKRTLLSKVKQRKTFDRNRFQSKNSQPHTSMAQTSIPLLLKRSSLSTPTEVLTHINTTLAASPPGLWTLRLVREVRVHCGTCGCDGCCPGYCVIERLCRGCSQTSWAGTWPPDSISTSTYVFCTCKVDVRICRSQMV